MADDLLATEATYDCTVTVCRGVVTVTTEGGKTCSIPTTGTKVGLSSNEQQLLESLKPGKRSFVLSELVSLRSIRDKLTVAPVIAPVLERLEERTTQRLHRGHSSMVAPVQGDMDATERQIKSLEKIAASMDADYTEISYDIPQELNRLNPSKWLWRHGFRRQLSNWVLLTSNLNHPEVVAWLEVLATHGIVVDTLDVAKHEKEKIKRWAVRELENKIRQEHTSLINNIASADAKLREIQLDDEKSSRELEVADAARDNRVRSIIKTACEQLDAAIKCAELFDETMKNDDLVTALRAAIQARASAFNAQMRHKGSKTVRVNV